MVIHSCNQLLSIDGIPEVNHSLDPSGKEKQSKQTNTRPTCTNLHYEGNKYGKMSCELYHPTLGREEREGVSKKVGVEPSPGTGKSPEIWRHQEGDYVLRV